MLGRSFEWCFTTIYFLIDVAFARVNSVVHISAEKP